MFKQLRNQGEPVNASSGEHHREKRLRERVENAQAIVEVVRSLDPELKEKEIEWISRSVLKELNEVSIEKDDIRIRMRKILGRRIDDSDLVRSFIDKIDWVNAKENELLNLVIKLEQNPNFLRSSSISKSELLEEWLVFSEPCRDILQKKIKANREATRLAEEKARAEEQAKQAERDSRLLAEEKARAEEQAKQVERDFRLLAEEKARAEEQAKQAERKSRLLAEEKTRLAEEKTRLVEERIRLAEEENARLRKQLEESQGRRAKQKSPGADGFFGNSKAEEKSSAKRIRYEVEKKH